jgi:hypothetical protein
MNLVNEVRGQRDKFGLGSSFFQLCFDGALYTYTSELGLLYKSFNLTEGERLWIDTYTATLLQILLVSWPHYLPLKSLTRVTCSVHPFSTATDPLPPELPTLITSHPFATCFSAWTQYRESTKSRAFDSTPKDGMRAVPAVPVKLAIS